MTKQKPSHSPSEKDTGEDFTNESLSGKIGKDLKQLYDDVLSEPVPDAFLSLLAEADEKAKK